MAMTVLIVSIVLTVIVLVLSLITIQKGYGYKHTIDPPVNKENDYRVVIDNKEEN